MSQPVTDYIANLKQPWQVEICTQLDQAVRDAIPDVEDRIQYGKPHYLKNRKYAAVISAAKAAVTLTIFNATALEDPVFEADGPPERKSLKIKEGQSVDYDHIKGLVAQAASTI